MGYTLWETCGLQKGKRKRHSPCSQSAYNERQTIAIMCHEHCNNTQQTLLIEYLGGGPNMESCVVL